MPDYVVKIEVRYKAGVLDPQGETIKNALLSLNYSGVKSVSTGKMFELRLAAASSKKALSTALEMADRLLANPVIEDFSAEIEK